MKKNKILAVLLSVVMLVALMPAFSLTTTAADPGVIVNGDFSTYESYTGSSGQTAYKADGWDVRDWGVTMGASGQSGKGVQLSKDSSHKGATSLAQVIPVNTNATYTFSFYSMYRRTYSNGTRCFTYSLDLGTTSSEFSTVVVDQGAPTTGYGWQKTTCTVNTGSNKYLRIRFISTGSGSYDSFLDTVALSVTNGNAGDAGTHAKPTLKSFGTEKNRPASSSDNVIVQPGFESTTNAQWNTTNFLKQNLVTVEDDASIAHSGSKYLKYSKTNSAALTEWPMFEFVCPTAGEYVFSAWVRTPLLSANNTGAASIGIINPDTGKFLTYGSSGGSYDGHYSNPETQLRSTATDDDWHLRSVTFYVGAANSNVKIGIYGLKSTMYVDDISVHLLSKGVKYAGNQQGALSASTSGITNQYCASDNNLIPDCNMNGDPSEEFWTIGASGWNNGFLEFNKDATNAAHGNALHFKGTSPASNKTYRYIKFVYVEPNTSYTVSFDYRVVKTGNPLMFIDNNIEKNAVFHTPNLGSASNSWKTYSFTFSTGNYNRIGIVFKDGTGEAYFDDFRFFKNSDGIADEPAEELFPTLKHNADGEVLESRMEMNNGNLGLAFLFNLKVSGATRDNQFNANFDNATVDPFEDGGSYKLVKAGAVVTNQATVGQDEKAFKLDNLNSNLVIDVPGNETLKLFYTPEGDMIHYAVRVANIPEFAMETVIYMRPYYVFDYNGTDVTVYGDIVYDCYKEIPDINDGWLEWD